MTQSRPRHVAIIGSGVTGMTLGCMLARNGIATSIFEQQARPGGLMQTYRRQGATVPTGIHCLGALAPGQILWRYLKYAGVLDQLHLQRVDDACTARYRFADSTFDIPSGHDRLTEMLINHFPTESRAIRQFITDMRQIVNGFPLYNCRHDEENVMPFVRSPLGEYLDNLTDNRQLKCLLTANNALHNVPPSDCPLFVHFLIFDSLIQSTYRIADTPIDPATAFARQFEALGGQLHCQCPVTAIDCPDRQVTGLTAGGEQVQADLIIHTGHPWQLLKLCPPEAFRKSYHHRMALIENTMGCFGAVYQWHAETCPTADCDLYYHREWDSESHLYRCPTEDPTLPYIFMSATPPDAEDRQTTTVLVPTPNATFETWADSTTGHRPREYEQQKHRLTAMVEQLLDQLAPNTQSDRRLIDTFSPLTFRDYTGTPDGSGYGIRRSARDFHVSYITPRTKVRNLYMAGQNVFLSGILGAVVSSVHMAGVILGRQYLIEQIRSETES